ncbi:MAG: phosphoribosylglycinamide formyltransferase [Bacteroidota bacterium]|nr:phosphoribosylglycinamide formyltransferase [Bacteroidota bacterium]
MKKIAIFASGSGSNAENLVRYFEKHTGIEIAMMVSDRKNAFVFERMRALNIPSMYMPAGQFENGEVLKLLKSLEIDFIVLAGFLKLMPATIIKEYEKKIINIHPALLPKFGGKGMYGMHVHNAVVNAGEQITGITIHYVDENFDEGEIIARFETPVEKGETAESIASKINELEMQWFPVIVEKIVMEK